MSNEKRYLRSAIRVILELFFHWFRWIWLSMCVVASLNIHPGAIIFSKFKIRKTRPTIGTMRRNRKAFKYLLKLRNIRRGSVYASIFVDTGLWIRYITLRSNQRSSELDVAKPMIASARNCQSYSISFSIFNLPFWWCKAPAACIAILVQGGVHDTSR